MKVLSLVFMSVVVVSADNEVRKGLLLARENILPVQGEPKPVKRMANASPNPNPSTPNTPLSPQFGPPTAPMFSNTQQFNNPQPLNNPQQFNNLQPLNSLQPLNNPQQFNNLQPLNSLQPLTNPEQFNILQPFNNPQIFTSPKPNLLNQQNSIDSQYFNNQYQFNNLNQQQFNNLNQQEFNNNPFNHEQQQQFNNNPFNHEQQHFNHDQFNGYFGPYSKPCNRHFTHHFSNQFNHNSLDNHFNQNSLDNYFNNHDDQHFEHPHYQFPGGNQLYGNQDREFYNDIFNEIHHEHRFDEFNGPSQHPRSGISVVLA